MSGSNQVIVNIELTVDSLIIFDCSQESKGKYEPVDFGISSQYISINRYSNQSQSQVCILHHL